MKYFLSLFLVLSFIILNAQYISISELTILDNQIKESSGLINFDTRLITLNDSGNSPFLYEIDTINGNVLRTVTIDNALNTDWEDIAQDSLYIYIGDFGNNSGDRTDLRIYRISKIDYIASDNVTADTINFVYNNQTDFTSSYRNTEFDAEALSVYNDSLIIFTKDWVNNKTRTYTLPKIPGTYTAFQRDTFNCNGLITGSVFNNIDTSFILCGYTETLAPFIIKMNDFSNTNIFSGNVSKINLTDSIGGGQTEAVCLNNTGGYFLSREEFTYQTIILEPKLYSFDFVDSINYIGKIKQNKFKIYPNPANNYIVIESKALQILQSIDIVDITGKTQLSIKTNKETPLKLIDISNLKSGLYLLTLKSDNFTQTINFIKE